MIMLGYYNMDIFIYLLCMRDKYKLFLMYKIFFEINIILIFFFDI